MMRHANLRFPSSRSGRVWALAAALAIALVVAAVAFNRRAARETLDDLGAVPFRIASSLTLAANAATDDRALLRLACSEDGSIHLVLRTKLAVGKEFYTAGMEGLATIYVGDVANRLETRMRLVSRATYDTLVSARLSATATSALAGFLGNAAPPKVSVMTLETGTFLDGQVGRGQVANFAQGCS